MHDYVSVTVGRVLVGGKDEGAGFVLAAPTGGRGRVALTAAHVVGSSNKSSTRFVTADGRTVPIEHVEAVKELDVAALHLGDDVEGFSVARAQDRLAWRVEARPGPNDPRLTGTVTDPRRPFSKPDAPNVSVVQLEVDQVVHNYKGYSGSPVELVPSDLTTVESTTPPVIGVLIEHFPVRSAPSPGQRHPPASNVLYAVPIEAALDRLNLEACWAPVVDNAPSDSTVVPRYLAALTTRLTWPGGTVPHVALNLVRGERAPAGGSPARRRGRAELRALLGPRAAPGPPRRAIDEGEPVADLAAFQKRWTRVVLLGSPGAGKSTTLRHLFTRLGAPWREGTADGTTKIPILANLGEWHDESSDLTTFLQTQLRRQGALDMAARLPALMGEGRLVLLLDGLNEIPRMRRAAITDQPNDPRVDAVAELGHRAGLDGVGCVLTCRSADFQGGPDWHDVHLVELDDERVDAFARAYFHDEPEAATLITSFRRDLAGSRRLRTLVSNPFFLLRTLEFYDEVRTIPERLTDLLTFGVAMALPREETEDTNDHARPLLEALAYHMTKDELVAVDPDRAVGWLAAGDAAPVDLTEAQAVWQTAQQAGLTTIAGDEVRFSHQLIQEFFAACHLRDQPLTGTLLETVARPSFTEVRLMWADLAPGLADRVVAFLHDDAAGVRAAAASVLGPLGDRGATDPLARLLTDANDVVRRSAALALATLADNRAVPVLVEQLRNTERGARLLAAQALAGLADARSVPGLLDALRADESGEVRVAAAAALGSSGDERALRPLVEILVNSTDRAVSDAAARALGRLGDPRAVPDLMARLVARADSFAAIDGLLALGDEAHASLAEALRHDRSATRRERAAFALGLSRRPRFIPDLVAALGDTDRTVQEQSASALGHFGEPALAALLQTFEDGDVATARWVLYALGVMGGPRVVPHLLAALQSGSEPLAEMAARSLRRSTGAVEALEDILSTHPDPETRWFAAHALGGQGEQGIAVLVESTRSDDDATRFCALGGLSTVAERTWIEPLDPRVAAALVDALYATDSDERTLAALALGSASDPRAVPALATLLRADNPDLCAQAFSLLAGIHDPSAVDVLVTALVDAGSDSRRAACVALGGLLSSCRPARAAVDAALAASADDSASPREVLIGLLKTWRAPQAQPAQLIALRRAMPSVVAALDDPDDDVVSAALRALESASRPAIDVSYFLPDDAPVDERYVDWWEERGVSDDERALAALVRETAVPLAYPPAVTALVAHLHQPDGDTDNDSLFRDPLCASAASLLGAVGDERVVPDLAALLADVRHEVVSAAGRALARIGGPSAVSALAAALGNNVPSDAYARFVLKSVLLELVDDATAHLVLDALRGLTPPDGDSLVEVLDALGEPALLPLVAALGDPDAGVALAAAHALDPASTGVLATVHRLPGRRRATDALDRLGEAEVEMLLAATHHDNSTVSRVAVAVLAKLGHPAGQVAEEEPPSEPPPPPPRHVDDLLNDLASNDPSTRVQAASAVGRHGDDVGVAPLIGLLDDPSAQVRRAAAEALGRLGDRSAVEPLGRLLSDPEWGVAHSAMLTLGALGGLDALGLIVESLDTDTDLRESAAIALRQVDVQTVERFGTTTVVDAVLAALRLHHGADQSWEDRAVYCAAQDVLLTLGAPVTERLLSALEDDHETIRHLAVTVLAANAELHALPLLEWMSEHDPSGTYVSGSKPRDAAASGVSTIRSAHRVREPLIEAMASDHRLTRYGSAILLANGGWRGATATLVEALGDPDRRVRFAAARALGVSEDERGIAPLTAALADPDATVQAAATAALVRHGPVVAPTVAATLDAAAPHACVQALGVLGECGSAADVQRVATALRDPTAEVCRAAASALKRLVERGKTANIDRAGLTDALRAALHTASQNDRGGYAHLAIIAAYEKVETTSLVDVLIEALHSGHRGLRSAAAQRLGALADPRAVPSLNRALSDSDSMVREDAADSLRRFTDASSVEPLIALLANGTGVDRQAAIDTLVAIGDTRAAAPMVDLLYRGSPDLRSAAAAAIVTLPDDVAIRRLVDRLKTRPPDDPYDFDDESRVPPELDVLVRLGVAAAPALVEAVATAPPTGGVDGWASEGLQQMGEGAIPALIEGLGEIDGLGEEADDRAWVCAIRLAELGDAGWEALTTAFVDVRWQRRAGATFGMATTGRDEALPLLRDALADSVAEVRAVAANVAGVLGSGALVEPVAALLDDDEAVARFHAAAALVRLGDDRGLAGVLEALASEDLEMACEAATILGELDLVVGLEPLITSLSGGPPQLRVACARALGELVDTSALDALDRAASDASKTPDGTTVGDVAARAAARIREFADFSLDVTATDGSSTHNERWHS
ncbi:HEAT repeat domain-containing protein [Actinomycetospora lutea]|uniref:HEAT repeat domain-containing protein n=1 Tax=Actinomycetospora lutea TaxID=663604 RepID=UPI00236616D4|nr:HEAT repeat domain-containing protein [Actinomycetospora lutea]MDD7942873.1 HEAT repeat domain-containing protein [Actinomycetospora lutea]